MKTVLSMASLTLKLKGLMESVLEEAQRLIHGARRESYGHPLDEYTRLAALISTALSRKLKEPLTAEESLLIMVLLKINRHISDPEHRDSLVDAAGYLGCIDLALEERRKRATTSPE